MQRHIAIFGSTSYIGTKLIIELYNAGHRLTLFTRTARKLEYLNNECFYLHQRDPNICIVEQQLKEEAFNDIVDALKGVDAVYYLVHSLYVQEKRDFFEEDNRLATLVALACKKASVEQIIFMGGLGVEKPGYPLSKHLLSRQETAKYLRLEHDGVTEFRAGVVIGAGNSSFEIVRSLATKLPFIFRPYEREGLCQPIFVDDVIAYLTHALMHPAYYNQIAEIGSEDVLTYSQMVQIYAATVLNKKLIAIPLPFFEKILTPYLLGRIISRMSGIPAILIERLLEGMFSAAIIGDHPLSKIDPQCPVVPKSYAEAVKIAAKRDEEALYQSVWATPYELSVFNPKKSKQFLYMSSQEKEGMLFETYSKVIDTKDIDTVFERVKNIGGMTGYYSPKWLWQIRGWIDIVLGGRGLMAKRRNPRLIRVGDRIDFWIVTFYQNLPHNKVLRLKADMITPGDAWLQFTIHPLEDEEKALFTLTAYFEPHGILGYLYWYSLYFIHKTIFKTMVERMTAVDPTHT
ncbi:MAG TPA: SDR family oxidoreductase [Campylobacteraceae bacterium]|nr:SDR family oxidoreductase [Campylobacteraceae bacterium]